jgi:hypothetical protein
VRIPKIRKIARALFIQEMAKNLEDGDLSVEQALSPKVVEYIDYFL